MTALMSDLRSAIRALTAARGFTTVAVGTLALALALCVGVLTVLNAYVIRPMPYPAAERLFRVEYAAPNQPPPRGLEQLEWSSLADVIEVPIAWDLDVFYLLGDEYPESTPGAWVTPGYMQGLGVRPALGRSFVASDYQPGSPTVALISHRLWESRFGSDPAVIGRSIRAYVSDRPDEPEAFTVVGVLPRDLWHISLYTELLSPLRAATYPYWVRLQPDVPAAIAAERITALVRASGSTVPEEFAVVLTSLHDSYTASLRPLLWAVATAAGLVLLIAGANVSVLMLVRGRRRQKELAVRLALGASNVRVARLLVAEVLIIGVAATVTAIAASRAAMSSLAPLIEQVVERRAPGGLEGFEADGRVLLAAAACGLLVTIICALIPLVVTWRANLSSSLSSVGRTSTDAPGSPRSRAVLIGVEVAASLALLVGAALMTETAVRMLGVDFGIEADSVVTASLALRQRSYPDTPSRVAFYERLTRELAGVGGSASLALGDWWPLQGSRPRRVEASGPVAVTGSANPFAVSADYFATLGMTLRDGRGFDAGDGLGGQRVVIVSESLAARLWPGARAVGQRLTIYPDGAGEPIPSLVVGVVNDVRQSHMDTDLFDAYLPLAQRASRFAFLYLRAPGSETWDSELRLAVARVDPEVALGAPRPLAAGLEQERARPKFLAYLLAVFAVFSCALALVGMYGVIAYAVRQRQREIAVRIAIGATARSVTAMFVRHGAMVLVAGIIAGMAGAVALGRVLQSQLYEVRAAEPRVLVAAALAFAVCGLAAVWWPAWRAATTDPTVALKEE